MSKAEVDAFPLVGAWGSTLLFKTREMGESGEMGTFQALRLVELVAVR